MSESVNQPFEPVSSADLAASADPATSADSATSADLVPGGTELTASADSATSADLVPGGTELTALADSATSADLVPGGTERTASADSAAGGVDSTVGGTARRRGPRRAVRRGTEREAVLGVSADERPTDWSEGANGGAAGAGYDSNDEQLRRDVPPHWS